ncbi:MAG: PVC-type heme-binding CxxCH protein [Planctomycetaceae bacterium]
MLATRQLGSPRLRGLFPASLVLLLAGGLTNASSGDAPATGPQTESRFPPLVVPPGFKATLFACDPLVEYPSVIALGPRPGSVFVAYDYMSGLGTEIVRRDEIRLVEDTDGDGYADKSTVVAGGFNSIQGLAYHAGTVFAMHAPLLTAVVDTNGDGIADERRDLLSGLGLPPEENPPRLHCANGVVAGHDGWLYLAMGDHGVDVPRPEGNRLVLHGGGILRCRPDGRDLHVFATGLRNIYDVALDEELNVFVRDNENDGGDYMIRVCDSFFGADHGYPYKYYERPQDALPPLADLGRGSSAGGACYLETAFPPEFRGNLFFCEWGRSVVRYERRPSGSSFAPMKEIEFAAGASNDPYGFRPTDVIVDHDGSLVISDWGDGQRPKRGRGRLYRISYVGTGGAAKPPIPTTNTAAQSTVAELDSPSHLARVAAQVALERNGREGLQAVLRALQDKALGPLGRMHGVWVLAHVGGRERIPDLIVLAQSDADPRARVQAVRAIADLCDPAFDPHSKNLPSRNAEVARQLSELAIDQDPPVLREVIIALGRLRWVGAPEWLRTHLGNPDAALAHAAMQTLRGAENDQAVLSLLDESDDRPIWRIALAALTDRADPAIVDGLIDRLGKETNPERRQRYADALARVYKKAGPWTYWGYRAPPRPANDVAWERTQAIEEVLDCALADSNRDVRTAILLRMQREQVPVRVATLGHWLQEDRAADHVKAILDSLAKAPIQETRDLLEDVVRTRDHALGNRQNALSMLIAGLDETSQQRLTGLADQVDEGPLLVELLLELGKRPKVDSRQLLLRKLDSADANVREAALKASTSLRLTEAAGRVPDFLKDGDVRVRRAAAVAAGALDVKDSVALLLSLTHDADAAVCSASLDSLRALREPAAVDSASAALIHPESRLAAIDYLAEFGTAAHAEALAAVASSNRSADVLAAVVRALSNWEIREPADSLRRQELARMVAKVQGGTGALVRWHVWGPFPAAAAAETLAKQDSPDTLPAGARAVLASGIESQLDLDASAPNFAGSVWLAISDVTIAGPIRAQFLASSNRPIQIDVNGRTVFRREKEGTFQPDSERFETELPTGMNRVVVQLDAGKPARFHVRFRPLSSSAEQERLVQFALKNNGDVAKGRELFLNAEKSLCAKCHRIGDKGENAGPELTGIGERFARIHIIESILDPSRSVAAGYESVTVALTSGLVITGVKVAEDQTTLTLGDEKGARHVIPKSDVEQRSTQPRSIMPDGLEKHFTDGEFLDLLTFLLSEKKPRSP